MTMNMVRPTTNIDKHITILERLIKLDEKNKDLKNLRYHRQALETLKEQK